MLYSVLSYFVIIFSHCLAELNIVQPKTLSCYTDKVQFMIAENVPVKFVNTTNGNCSEIPDTNRTVAFNYKECGGKATRLEPYGPLTKLDFLVELIDGEVYDLGTQCFLDDTIGWYSDKGLNVSDGHGEGGQEQGFVNPPELSGTFSNSNGQSTKYVKLGDVVIFKIGISDDNTYYHALLPYDCKFSNNRQADNENDVQFVYKGCPQKLAGFIGDMKRETLTSYSLTFHAFQIDYKPALYIKCSTIRLCMDANDPRCNNPCFSNDTLPETANTTEITSQSTLSATTVATSTTNPARQKREVKENEPADKVVKYQESINVNGDNNASNVPFNFAALILSLVVVLLVLVLIIGIVFMIHQRQNQRKIFRMAQFSRSTGAAGRMG